MLNEAQVRRRVDYHMDGRISLAKAQNIAEVALDDYRGTKAGGV